MNTKIFYIGGRPYVAVRVATCSGKNYTNFVNPSKSSRND